MGFGVGIGLSVVRAEKTGGGIHTALSRNFCWVGLRGCRRLGRGGSDEASGGCCGFGGGTGEFVIVDALRRGLCSVGTRKSKRGD